MQPKYLFIVSEYLKIFIKSSKEEGKVLVLVLGLYYKLMSKMKFQWKLNAKHLIINSKFQMFVKKH